MNRIHKLHAMKFINSIPRLLITPWCTRVHPGYRLNHPQVVSATPDPSPTRVHFIMHNIYQGIPNSYYSHATSTSKIQDWWRPRILSFCSSNIMRHVSTSTLILGAVLHEYWNVQYLLSKEGAALLHLGTFLYYKPPSMWYLLQAGQNSP